MVITHQDKFLGIYRLGYNNINRITFRYFSYARLLDNKINIYSNQEKLKQYFSMRIRALMIRLSR